MAANASKMMQIQRQVMMEDLYRKEQRVQEATPGEEDEEEKFELDAEGNVDMSPDEMQMQLGLMGTYQKVFLQT
jgi:hypothetical protein